LFSLNINPACFFAARTNKPLLLLNHYYYYIYLYNLNVALRLTCLCLLRAEDSVDQGGGDIVVQVPMRWRVDLEVTAVTTAAEDIMPHPPTSHRSSRHKTQPEVADVTEDVCWSRPGVLYTWARCLIIPE